MKRLFALALLAASPGAYAQDDAEGRELAAAFSQADLDLLGSCQARVEGAALVYDAFAAWLQQQGYTSQLEAVRKTKEAGPGIVASLATVRRQAGAAKGLSPASADAAHDQMLGNFKRLLGEDEPTSYARMQALTVLPPDCRTALKRGRWKVEIEGHGEDE
jgi:hypothetical protein